MDDLPKAQDYESYIIEKRDNFSTQESNCSNCYINIKNLLDSIESENPDFDITEFSDYLQILEEYYSSFASMQDVLDKFSTLNTDAQELNSKVEDFQRSIYDLEINKEALTQDLTFKDQRIAKLEEEIQIITNDYFNLYSSNTKETMLKDEDVELCEKEKEEKTNLTSKVNKLKEENNTLKQAKASLMQKMELHENDLRAKYIFKPEHERIIKGLSKEIKDLKATIEENDILIIKLRNVIEDNREAIDYLNNDYENKLKELEKMRAECEEMKSHKGYKKLPTINLNNIVFDNHRKEEEFCAPILDQGDQQQNDIEKDKQNYNTINKTLKESYNLALIERNEDSENETNLVDDNSNNTYFPRFQRTSTEIINIMEQNDFNKFKEMENEKNKAMLIEMTNKEKEKQKENEKGSTIKTAYQMMRPPMTRNQISAKMQDDYYKQFFFLTYQAMKLNSDIIDPFIAFNPEKLYNDCKAERIPFHKFYKWLKKKIAAFIDENCNNTSNNFYENFVSFISAKLI